MPGSSSVNNNWKETLRNSKSKISSQFHQKARKTQWLSPWQLSRCCEECHKGCDGTTASLTSCHAARSVVHWRMGPFLCTSPVSVGFFLGAVSVPCGCQSVTSLDHRFRQRWGLMVAPDDCCICMNTGITDETRIGVSILLFVSGEHFLKRKSKLGNLMNRH